MRRVALVWVCACACACALVACRSAPSKYYTLVAPPGDAAPAIGSALQLDVLPVDVPPDVDRTQMVVRLGTGQVAPVDTRSWIAPLALEIRRALADDLIRTLGARDIAGLTPAPGMPVYRVKLNVQRFESSLGDRALIDAVWSVRDAGGTAAPLTCATRASEPAPGEYAGLAEAHQKALAKIAAAIATGIRTLAAGGDGDTRCPP
jgi:hypothetical protein